MDALRSQILKRFKGYPFKTLKSIYSSKVKLPDGISVRGDIVGQPNPISNIRPITFHVPQNETLIEQEFRIKREQALNWHEEFWRHHNTRFIKERKEYIQKLQEKKSNSEPLSADEISIFYKAFLDKYWKTHMWYNVEWYKQNAILLKLAFQVEVDRFKRKLIV